MLLSDIVSSLLCHRELILLAFSLSIVEVKHPIRFRLEAILLHLIILAVLAVLI